MRTDDPRPATDRLVDGLVEDLAPVRRPAPLGLALPVIALAAHYTLTAAFARAEVSALAPFEYTSLIWATLLGYLVWRDIPSLEVGIGASIIVACGLYVIHRESVVHRRAATIVARD